MVKRRKKVRNSFSNRLNDKHESVLKNLIASIYHSVSRERQILNPYVARVLDGKKKLPLLIPLREPLCGTHVTQYVHDQYDYKH
jgi:hypothetical protein